MVELVQGEWREGTSDGEGMIGEEESGQLQKKSMRGGRFGFEPNW